MLKYLVVLGFLGELFGASFIQFAQKPELRSSQNCVSAAADGPESLSVFIISEPGQEEREEKHPATTETPSAEIFSYLEKFRTVDNAWLPPNKRNTSQPSLYTLFGVLLI